MGWWVFISAQTYVDGGLSTDDLGRERVQFGHILQGGREETEEGTEEGIKSTLSMCILQCLGQVPTYHISRGHVHTIAAATYMHKNPFVEHPRGPHGPNLCEFHLSAHGCFSRTLYMV